MPATTARLPRVRAWLLLLLLLLVGCGARPTPAPPPAAPFTLVAPAPTLHAADAPLEVIGHFREGSEVPLRALLADFATREGVAVRYEGAAELPALLRARLEGGQPPDVILLPVPNWLPELASAGAIAPLDEAGQQAVRQHFGPAWQALASHQGTLYGVPLDANAKSLLWYRPALVAQPPATLAELEALAEQLAGAGVAPFALPGGAGWPLSDWFEALLLAEAGPEVYDDLMAHRIPWTDPRVQAAAERFARLLRPAWLLGGDQGSHLPLREESFAAAFAAEPGAALWMGQGSIVRGFVGAVALQPGSEVEVAPFPLGGAVVGVGSVAVAANQRPETLALLAFLAQPKTVEPWVRGGGFVSPNRNVPLEAYPDALARHEAELIVGATLFRYDLSDRLPPNLGGPFLWDTLRAMLAQPDQIPALLAELEAVATREQGRVR